MKCKHQAFFILICVGLVQSYRDFQQEIPNGANIPSPCNKSDIWPGVGHEMIAGSGPRNKFGSDFAANANKWTKALCQMDSDGDGKTNGQELGDPTCVWTKGAKPAVVDSSKLSHPGICEPINSPNCKGKLDYLKEIDSCKTAMNLTSDDWCPAIRSPDVKTLTLRFDESVLPSEETIYFCQTFDFPDDQQYHIIAWEPIISNPDIMHHVVLYICDSPKSQQLIEKTKNYTKPMQCDLVPLECPNSTIGWAFGVPNRCYSSEIGMPMGKDVFKKAILQIHYNNHFKKSGYRDASGLKIYYTAKKRQFEIASVGAGQYNIAIPPKSSGTTIVGRALESKECGTAKLGTNSSFKIISMLFHMHKTGVHGKLIIEKSNGSKVTLFDGPFTYDRPALILWETNEPVLESGDNIMIECTYQSNDRANWTFFGEKTSDEMCLGGLEVYPRPNGANYVEMGGFGLCDECQFEALVNAEDFCKDSTFEEILESMLNDNVSSLARSCGDSSSTECCEFLSKHEFESYPCVYAGSFLAVNTLLSNKTSEEDIKKTYANMISCVPSMRYLVPAEAQGSTAAKHKNHATKLQVEPVLLFLALLTLLK